MLGDKVENELPAFKDEVTRMLKKKAEMHVVEEKLKEKVSLEDFEDLRTLLN